MQYITKIEEVLSFYLAQLLQLKFNLSVACYGEFQEHFPEEAAGVYQAITKTVELCILRKRKYEKKNE
jgi:hypothetical protein